MGQSHAFQRRQNFGRVPENVVQNKNFLGDYMENKLYRCPYSKTDSVACDMQSPCIECKVYFPDTMDKIFISHNKQSVQCQHSFYAVRCADIVRCNKCGAEFPLISTC